MGGTILASKATTALEPYVVNFSDKLQFGEGINGAAVTVSVHSGVDPSPLSLLDGTVTYDASGNVSQNITGGLAGVIYNLVYLCTGTGSHNYVKVLKLAVLAPEDM